MRNINHLIIILFFMSISSCSKRTGSSEKPIELPTKEMSRLMDATGCPTKTILSPDMFIVNLDNQTDWFITSIEICLRNKTSGVSRNYLGTPYGFAIEKGQYDKIKSIAPKSSGDFIFNIGKILYKKEQQKNGSNCDKENVFEPFEWMIVKANGYKT